MYNVSAADAIRRGIKYWNDWRLQNKDSLINLRKTDLRNLSLDRWLQREETSNIGADLRNIDFTGADLTNANLYGAKLDDSVFENAIMVNARLRRSSCIRAVFRNANLFGSNFHKAIVDHADFRNADLSQADFTTLSSKGIKLKGAIINNIEIEEPGEAPEGPWNVDPYQLVYVEDIFEVEAKGQEKVRKYLMSVLTDLKKLNPADIKNHEAYTSLLNRVNSLLLMFKEDTIPTTLVTAVKQLNVELINYLRKHPKSIYDIHWRTFEELIAEILSSFGWDVELTDPTKDGGYDIMGIYKDESGIKHHWLIECKKWSAENKVGVEILRALYGVKTHLGFGNALLATTSFFTEGVQDFKASTYELETRDFNDIINWVNQYKPSASGNLYIREDKLVRKI